MADSPSQANAEREGRFFFEGRSLREHAARGTVINAAFYVGLAGLGLLRRVLVAAFLTTTEYGLWGLVFVAVATVVWLKDIGIGDKFVQQSEDDQELAFHKAFTLNLIWTGLFFVLMLVAIPLFSLLYGQPGIILPGYVFATAVLGSALQAPTWVFYRQMRFVRQRLVLSVEPVVGFIATIALGIAGAGVWALVLGFAIGVWCSGIVALLASPFSLRWVFDRSVLREYVEFSWPLLIATGSALVIVQTSVTVSEAVVGLAGLGAIGLAGNIASFADRVDQVLTQTLYPAICAVRDRRELLWESFVKSNRLALMWGVPFGVGLALFAPDFVTHVLGEKWRPAAPLLQAFGGIAALKQVAFSWTAYHRALDDTKPIAANGLVSLAVFGLTGVPAIVMWGLTGYAVAMAVLTVVQVALRGYFLSRLFGRFDFFGHAARAVVPSIPAALAVLGLRLANTGDRGLAFVLGEFALYLLMTVAATALFERALLREVLGYLRPGTRAAQPA